MPSDSLKLWCFNCGHKQTIRVRPGAGRSWTCKKCHSVNPGPKIIDGLVAKAIAAGKQLVRGGKKPPPAAGAPAAGRHPSSPAAPAAGTTVGRRAARAAQVEHPASNRKVEGSSERSNADRVDADRRVAAKSSETSKSSASSTTPSLGRRLLSIAKEAII